jgi:hypothetical protein
LRALQGNTLFGPDTCGQIPVNAPIDAVVPEEEPVFPEPMPLRARYDWTEV